jgi:hypothetical protein
LIRIVVLNDLKHLVKFTKLVAVEVETFEAVILVEFEKATHRAGPGWVPCVHPFSSSYHHHPLGKVVLPHHSSVK